MNDRRLPDLRSDSTRRWLVLGIGLARVAIGVGFWVDPGFSVRVAGLDRFTAPRTGWLARMTAGRDVAIGAGTAAAVLRPGAGRVETATWLLAGAVSDAGDAVAITQGAREGRLTRVLATATAVGAGATAVAGLALAAGEVFAARVEQFGHAHPHR